MLFTTFVANLRRDGTAPDYDYNHDGQGGKNSHRVGGSYACTRSYVDADFVTSLRTQP